MKNTDKKTVVCLIGPTAVGKTEVALNLAKKIGAEIISCDSMQVYKGIDIASSKPTKLQRKAIPHHFLDIIKPSQEYNAARFSNAARGVINDIHKKGKLPLVVAGTGLYLRALLDGLFRGPGRNSALRQKLYQQAKKYGPSYLYRRLKNKDLKSALNIHRHDLRRIIRALEVYESTGEPISKWREQTRGIRGRYELCVFGLARPREQLYVRIEKRVDKMFRQGLAAEIRRLTKGKISKTAKSLLGYKEIAGFIKGDYSKNEASELLKRNTRRYAKRQISWFKREKSIKWIEVNKDDSPEMISKTIYSYLNF